MRPDGLARRASISGIFERYATPPDGMQRRPKSRYIELRTLGQRENIDGMVTAHRLRHEVCGDPQRSRCR